MIRRSTVDSTTFSFKTIINTVQTELGTLVVRDFQMQSNLMIHAVQTVESTQCQSLSYLPFGELASVIQSLVINNFWCEALPQQVLSFTSTLVGLQITVSCFHYVDFRVGLFRIRIQ